MLRTQPWRLLSPEIEASPVPAPLPPRGLVGGSIPLPPPRGLLFLSWVLMARGEPDGAKTKIYNLQSLLPPTLRKQEPQRGQFFRVREPNGSCARARRPLQWARGHRACVTAPPLDPPLKGRSVSRGPGVLLNGIGQGTLAPYFEKSQ
ncbi:Hypothetical predicted protein, partial [Marmota monax]